VNFSSGDCEEKMNSELMTYSLAYSSDSLISKFLTRKSMGSSVDSTKIQMEQGMEVRVRCTKQQRRSGSRSCTVSLIKRSDAAMFELGNLSNRKRQVKLRNKLPLIKKEKKKVFKEG
jgi:hypothetical protein